MPVYFNAEKGRWLFQFRRKINGRCYNINKSLPSGFTRVQAEAYDRQEVAKLYGIATGVTKPVPLIDDAVTLYLTHRCAGTRLGAVYARYLTYTMDYWQGRPLSDARQVALDYIKSQTSKLRPSTIASRLAYLKGAIRYAYIHHDCGAEDYALKMRLPVYSRTKSVNLSRKEVLQQMRSIRDLEFRALLKIAYYSGMRWRSEILALTPENIAKGYFHLEITKNADPLVQPIHPKLNCYLKRIPFKRSPSMYTQLFQRNRDLLGWTSKISLHTYRHSFATNLLNSGADLDEVQLVLNHRSKTSTRIYAQYSLAVKERIIRKL